MRRCVHVCARASGRAFIVGSLCRIASLAKYAALFDEQGVTFEGFLDIVGPKGDDGFGNATATEVLLRASYMFDIGGAKSGLKAGVGIEYWDNKFGCDNSKFGTSGSGITNTCRSTSPMVLATYKF